MYFMSGAARKRRVVLLVSSTLFFIILYTFWGQSEPISGIATTWKSQLESELERRVRESQNNIQQVPDDDDDPERNDLQHTPDHELLDVDTKVGKTTATTGIQPTVGKVTISFGEAEEVYERAIRSHELHNRLHGYSQFVLRERLVPGLWSKHAYIFSIIVQELSKPEALRLKWLMWLDRDTVLMNPLLPLEMFIPPPDFEKIHLLTTNDRNGLNNGVFFLKVCDWSLKLFSTALTFPHYNPGFKLQYSEQSAMEEVLKIDWFNRSALRVPQRWFNAFPPPPPGGIWNTNHARPGNLLIHFASNRDGLRPERMNRWMDVADKDTPEWSITFNETNYGHDIDEYWRRLRDHDEVSNIIADLEKMG